MLPVKVHVVRCDRPADPTRNSLLNAFLRLSCEIQEISFKDHEAGNADSILVTPLTYNNINYILASALDAKNATLVIDKFALAGVRVCVIWIDVSWSNIHSLKDTRNGKSRIPLETTIYVSSDPILAEQLNHLSTELTDQVFIDWGVNNHRWATKAFTQVLVESTLRKFGVEPELSTSDDIPYLFILGTASIVLATSIRRKFSSFIIIFTIFSVSAQYHSSRDPLDQCLNAIRDSYREGRFDSINSDQELYSECLRPKQYAASISRWTLPQDVFHDYVLFPREQLHLSEKDRWHLFRVMHPASNKMDSIIAAATNAIYYCRTMVVISEASNASAAEVTLSMSPEGFKTLAIEALRSINIAARSRSGEIEIYDRGSWKPLAIPEMRVHTL